MYVLGIVRSTHKRQQKGKKVNKKRGNIAQLCSIARKFFNPCYLRRQLL